MTSLTSFILMMGDGLAHGFLENLKVTAVSLLGLGSLDGWRYSGGTQAGIFFSSLWILSPRTAVIVGALFMSGEARGLYLW